jgi:hypothetical protein
VNDARVHLKFVAGNISVSARHVRQRYVIKKFGINVWFHIYGQRFHVVGVTGAHKLSYNLLGPITVSNTQCSIVILDLNFSYTPR